MKPKIITLQGKYVVLLSSTGHEREDWAIAAMQWVTHHPRRQP